MNCPTPAKRSYRTYKKAIKAADKTRNAKVTHGNAMGADCRVYHCACGNWHLTKQPLAVAA